MRIAVCIKHVPVVWAMKFDPDSKTLKREGVPGEISSFDVRALGRAVELRQAHGGSVTALTMGPPPARKSLETCLAMGADRAVHLCDPVFAGSDTLATARALAAGLRHLGFDLILCGRHSVDAETGQVGPEVAELLDIAQVTAARRIEVDAAAKVLRIERETDDGYELVEVATPVLISAAEDLAEEPAPTKEEREAAKQKPIETITAAELGIDAAQVGLSGSPTWVQGFETIASKRLGRTLSGESLEAVVEELVDRLLEHGLFGKWQEPSPAGAGDAGAAPEAVRRRGPSDVWVVAEVAGQRLRPVTHELVGKGAELARRLGSSLDVVLAGDDAGRHCAALAHSGAQRVLLAEHPQLATYDTERYAALLSDAIRSRQPGIVLLPSNGFGRDLAPRVAARLQIGLTGDCLDLDLDAEGRLVQLKPAFGGSVVAPILSRTLPEMATVRPGLLDAPVPDPTRRAMVERLEIVEGAAPRVRHLGPRASAALASDLDEAEIVVGIGMGLGAAEEIAAVEPLRGALGAALAATREVTDAGWLPKHSQVGFTGRSIAPRLYIAVGIRGAVYHMVGLRRAGIIVAINNDPKAAVFKNADYGIVGDYREVLPLLVRRLEAAKAR